MPCLIQLHCYETMRGLFEAFKAFVERINWDIE